MATPQSVGFIEQNLLAQGSSNYRLRATGPVMVLFGGTSFVTGLDIRALEATFGVKVDWRTMAVDPNYPNAWAGAGTQRTVADDYIEAFDVSGQTSMLFVQAGLFTQNTTGSTPATAFARLWTSVLGGGWLAARQRIELDQGADAKTVTVGSPFACAGVTGLMFAMIYTGIDGTAEIVVDPTPLWRGFKTGDFTNPGAWNALTTGSDITADIRVNGGTEAVTTTGAMYMQAGFRYDSASDAQGTVDVIVAAKK